MSDQASALPVGENTRVTLNFSLTLSEGDNAGEIIDSNMDKAPASFEFGDGSLLPGYENRLVGLVAGDERSFDMLPEEGFGQPNPNNIQQFKRSEFDDDMELAAGLVVSFADAANGELPGVIKEVDAEHVVVDFNHPLAGQAIRFDVRIVNVEPARIAG